jgi:hypothetical protein
LFDQLFDEIAQEMPTAWSLSEDIKNRLQTQFVAEVAQHFTDHRHPNITGRGAASIDQVSQFGFKDQLRNRIQQALNDDGDMGDDRPPQDVQEVKRVSWDPNAIEWIEDGEGPFGGYYRQPKTGLTSRDGKHWE